MRIRIHLLLFLVCLSFSSVAQQFIINNNKLVVYYQVDVYKQTEFLASLNKEILDAGYRSLEGLGELAAYREVNVNGKIIHYTANIYYGTGEVFVYFSVKENLSSKQLKQVLQLIKEDYNTVVHI